MAILRSLCISRILPDGDSREVLFRSLDDAIVSDGLLVEGRATAREFYARFPAQGFFDSSATRPEELPEWARDVVARLVDRDPSRRPGSDRPRRAAAGVAATSSTT